MQQFSADFPATSDRASDADWRCVRGAATSAWIAEAEALWRANQQPYLEQNARFIIPWTEAEDHRCCLYERRSSQMLAYAAVDIGPSTLEFLFGELSLYRHPILRMRISHSPVSHSQDGASARFAELLQQVSRDQPKGVIFLQGAAADGDTDAVLRHPAVRRNFVVLRYGRPRPHYRIDLPASYETFLAGMRKKQRDDIKRIARNLHRLCAGDWAYVSFDKPEQVEDFLEQAIPVSELTFQYKLMCAGLSDRPKLLRQFSALAEQGIWRGHLLRCRGKAVAFAYGYQLDDVYYFYETGYDPGWSHASVGKVLLVQIIRQVIASGTVRQFDFLYGDQDYKRRFANLSSMDAEYYLLPRTPLNMLLATGVSGTRRCAEGIGQALDRMGLKAKVRSLLRRQASPD